MEKLKKIKKKIKILLISLLTVLLFLTVGFGVYVGNYYHATETAEEAIVATAEISVQENQEGIVFAPDKPRAGFIFYPGGKVEHTAYAPLMKALAEKDILCVLVKMPFHLAVFDVNAADGIREQFPEIKSWYIGGHSLGGSMATSYVSKHTEDFEGLVLLAAYSTEDLSDSGLKVLSVYGSEDGVLNREKYEEYRSNLPEDTVEYVIEGGNHAGFGSYGEQEGDGQARISQGEQIAITVEKIKSEIKRQPLESSLV